MKNIIQAIKDCCSVRINCGKCGSGESVYFIPESIISKLEVAVAKIETTTSTCKDSLQVGNMAAMREALLMVKKLFDERIMFQSAIREAHKAVDAALAAPPRNCDVGTANEQEERYLKLKREHVDRMARCPAVGQSFFPDSLYWAQMPYESGVK